MNRQDSAHDEAPDVLYHELDLDDLLRRSCEGDSGAIEQLYYTHRDRLLLYTWVMTGDHETAVRCVKQVFSRVFRELQKVGSDEVLIHLFRAVRSALVDSGGPDPSGSVDLKLSSDTIGKEGDWTGFSTEISISPEQEEVMNVLLRLPESLRDAVVLRMLFRFSREEVVQIQDAPPEKVNVRLDEGLQRLRTQLLATEARSREDQSCSMAHERTWLNRLLQDHNASETSRLERHRRTCDDCQAIYDDVKRELSRVGELGDLTLPPFPKGDESDLLSEAREAAQHLASEETDQRAMDADLYQVLWLLPWGVLLVVVVSLLPLFFQNRDRNQNRSGDAVQTDSKTSRTLTLQTKNRKPVSKLILLFRIPPTQSITRIIPEDEYRNARVDRRTLREEEESSAEDPREERVRIRFAEAFPVGEGAIAKIRMTATNSSDGVPLQIQVLQARGPDGFPVDAEITLN